MRKAKFSTHRCSVCRKSFRGPGYVSHMRYAHKPKDFTANHPAPDPEKFTPRDSDVVIVVVDGNHYGFTKRGNKLEQIKLTVINL